MRRFADATERDRAIVRSQIGREPRAMIGVSKRCSHGCPQIVVTMPVLSSDARSVPELFPTLYWLSCPHLCKAVSALESEQSIEHFRTRLHNDPALASRLDKRHREYARERVSLVGPDDLKRLKSSYPNLYRRLVEPGIGGIGSDRGIKCLHLHLADYLSRGDNPVGEEVYSQLKDRAVSPECAEKRCLRHVDAVGVLNVGSNSVKLLVARAAEDRSRDRSGGFRLVTLAKQVRVTWLADGLSGGTRSAVTECRLTEQSITRTVEAVADLALEARSHGVCEVRVFGTAAVRRASNRDWLAEAIRSRTGLELAILSPALEAELSFDAACGALPPVLLESDSERVSVIDIGGASTEVAVGLPGEMPKSISIEVGSLTSLAGLSHGFDADGRLSEAGLSELMGRCRRALTPDVEDLLRQAQAFVAVGGSVTAGAALLLRLESYDSEAIHGFELRRDSSHELLVNLCQAARHERARMKGMISSGRVDSLIGGMAILISLMDAGRTDRVYVSERGLVEGIAARLLTCTLN